ncbi:MAG TPA: hypothetical protein DCF33_16510 [Saprospirales bacterium]|nr:hypothetical protein [Saprospirales bacterium]
MEQTQLVELLKSLSPDESTNFSQFIKLSQFNSSRYQRQVILLIETCLEHLKHTGPVNLTKETVYSCVFPGQEFVDGKLDKVMVEAQKVLRTFLIVGRYLREENQFQHQLDLAEEFRNRRLQNRYEQTEMKLQKSLEDAPESYERFYHQYQFEYLKYDLETIHNKGKGDLNIPNAIYALESFYYNYKLLLLNQYQLQQKIAHLSVPERLQQLIDDHFIPAIYLDGSRLLYTQKEIFELLKKSAPAPAEVRQFFNLLQENQHNFSEKCLSDFYAFLRNLCVLAVSANYENMDMAYLLHEIHKDNLERGFMHSENKISRSKYMAIANNALFIGKFDWAYAFIEKYKDELHEENETRDVYRLNLANYLFRSGKFEQCLDSIPDSSPSMLYALFGKRLELKSLYELKSDLLSYKLDAFKMFLSRTSKKIMSDAQRQAHIDFANLLYQLYSSPPGNPIRAELLTKRVLEKKQSAEYHWLLQKAQSLK